MTEKMIFLTQNHYITNNNWKLFDFLACYPSPTVDFDNMIHITAVMKTIGYREPKITLLKYKKNAVLDEYDYITNNTVDSRSNGSAYNKNPPITTFLFVPMQLFLLLSYNGQGCDDPVSRPVPRDGIRDGTGRVFSKGFLKKPVLSKLMKNSWKCPPEKIFLLIDSIKIFF